MMLADEVSDFGIIAEDLVFFLILVNNGSSNGAIFEDEGSILVEPEDTIVGVIWCIAGVIGDGDFSGAVSKEAVTVGNCCE